MKERGGYKGVGWKGLVWEMGIGEVEGMGWEGVEGREWECRGRGGGGGRMR